VATALIHPVRQADGQTDTQKEWCERITYESLHAVRNYANVPENVTYMFRL